MTPETMTLAAIAHALGDSPADPPGEAHWRLAAAAKAGSLVTLDDPHWIDRDSYRMERLEVGAIRVAKASFSNWLATYGSAADRASAAAAWASA